MPKVGQLVTTRIIPSPNGNGKAHAALGYNPNLCHGFDVRDALTNKLFASTDLNGNGKAPLGPAEERCSLEEEIKDLEKLLSLFQPVPQEWCVPKEKVQPINGESPELDELALYGPMGDFVRDCMPYTEATEPAMLAHLILALSSYIGPHPYVFGGKRQTVKFNAAVVGPTSTGRKGTSLVPVEEAAPYIMGDEFVREQWEHGGLSSGEGLIQKVADKTEYDPETKTKTIIEVEKRVFVIEQELSRVLCQTAKDGNVLSMVMREAFDSGNLSTITINPRKALGAHICIIGHITQEELKVRLGTLEMVNGFCNRFFWVYSKSNKSLPNSRGVPIEIIKKYGRKLGDLCRKASKVGEVTRTPAADVLWKKEYKTLREDKPHFTGKLLARGETIVLRLSLLYALMDGKTQIDVVHIRAALAVWEYNEWTVTYLFGWKDKQAADTPAESQSLRNKLLELLQVGEHSQSDLTKAMQKVAKADEVTATLEELAKEHLVHSYKQPTKSKPITMWSLNGQHETQEIVRKIDLSP